ncbi:hypothetical protein PROFUN_01700 [Planoprotostelium fungivorum]|uniref:phospholipase D n=1 Tax=Planoprotostelium fungivorum TaxID=1890364 RepID=A0A2P6MWA2_9EUKA|nr:hypothetical protein PROFUN_01700 [Planoprotostelium fungivorum]
MGQGESKSKRRSIKEINVDEFRELDAQTIVSLQTETQNRFTYQEIKLMYFVFNEFVPKSVQHGGPHILPEVLLTKLSGLGDNFVKFVVLSVIDPNNEGLSFTQILRLMSVISRGTEEELYRLVFAIYDSEKGGTLKKAHLQHIVSSLEWKVKEVFFTEYPEWETLDLDSITVRESTDTEVSDMDHSETSSVTDGRGSFVLDDSRSEVSTGFMSMSSSVTDLTDISLSDIQERRDRRAGLNSPSRALKKSFRHLFEKKVSEPSSLGKIDKRKNEGPEGSKHSRTLEKFSQWSKEVEAKFNHFLPKHEEVPAITRPVRHDHSAPDILEKAEQDANVLYKRQKKSHILDQLIDSFFGISEQIFFDDYLVRCRANPAFAFIGSGFGIMHYTRDSLLYDLEKRVSIDLLTPPAIEGWLLCSKSLTTSFSKRYCELKNGLLYIHKDQPQGTTRRPKVVPLVFSEVTVVDEMHGNEPRYAFLLSAKKGEFRKYFMAKTKKRRTGWLYGITANMHEIPDHRFNSFVPERQSIGCRWFVDGKDYFSFLVDVLNAATSEIFIADWWLSPELYLKRGYHSSIEDRLDILLKKKADAGIKVYVLVWNETKIAMTLNSYHTKTHLEKLSPNIKVVTHPPSTPIYWSHHQKIVVADQDIAFVGGLDLCFGRYDTPEHLMTDNVHTHTTWPGKDYFNEARKGFTNVNEAFVDGLDRLRIPRMPWHDIHACCDGAAARDVARNFIMRWNHHVISTGSSAPSLYPKTSEPNLKLIRPGILVETNTAVAQDVSRSKLTSSGLVESTTFSLLGYRDRGGFAPLRRVREIATSQVEIPEESTRKAAMQVAGKQEAVDEKAGLYNVMVPVCASLPFVQLAVATNNTSPRHHRQLKALDKNIHRRTIVCQYDERSFSSSCQVQVLRSLGSWSGSIVTETSIHQAYIELINHAQHFIYIENQYFISSLCGGGVQNRVAEAIYNRIRTAHIRKQVFRVIIILPAFPAGNGSWKDSPSVLYVMKWQYQTIDRGGTSIGDKLRAEFPGIVVEDYITFHSLRTHSYLGKRLQTEQIYVHCKCLIVDDRAAIIGSANINDRSMNGDRDSEICLLIEDNKKVDSYMNEQPYQVGKFAHELRKNLWREHLGLSEDDDTINDPICDRVYNKIWLKTSRKNTTVYNEIFKNIPRDGIETIHNFSELERTARKKLKHLKKDGGHILDEPLKMIRGHLVSFPLKFLTRESLAPGFRVVENWMSAETMCEAPISPSNTRRTSSIRRRCLDLTTLIGGKGTGGFASFPVHYRDRLSLEEPERLTALRTIG